MGLRERIAQFLALEPLHELTIDPFAPAPDLETQIAEIRSTQAMPRPWRVASVAEALGVPAYQRAVSLIASTTGMLSMQGYRNGSLMAAPPQLIIRPDPNHTPYFFYSKTSADMAKYGEFVWWIASRDSRNFPSALVNVPLLELTVDENRDNRMLPRYRWGNVESTRYSPANPTGQFVHEVYPLGEPFALRGQGPLQLTRAAVSVAVEAQEWAANFYATGGQGGTVIKSAVQLDETESAALKAQWTNVPTNVPRVIDPGIEDVDYQDINPQGAQMLDSREHQNGDAARTFGIPGSLLEYVSAGSSLTYQNRAELKGALIELCLMPLYLEPIEQTMSDLLPRSVVARFNVKGFLRADIKTRFDVHKIAIDTGIYPAEYAQSEEGIIAGDVEYAPMPASPPSSVPATIPYTISRRSGEVRCSGALSIRGRPARCNRLLALTGSFVGMCPKCKKVYASEEVADGITLTRSDDGGLHELVVALGVLATREAPAPIINNYTSVEPPPPAQVNVTLADGAIHNDPPVINVSAPIEAGAVQVNLPAPEVTVENTIEPTPITIENTVAPTPVEVHVEPTPLEVHNEVIVEPTPVSITNEIPEPRSVTKRIVRDAKNQITEIVEEPTDG